MGTSINGSNPVLKAATGSLVAMPQAAAPAAEAAASDPKSPFQDVSLVGRTGWGYVQAPAQPPIFASGNVQVPSFGQDQIAQPTEVTMPPAWQNAPTIKNTSFSSWGDPHETTGDGQHFNNELTGNFLALTTASGDFTIEKQQSHVPPFPDTVTLNTKIAVKYLNDTVSFDATNQTLTVDGKSVPLQKGYSATLPSGMTVSYDGQHVNITTPKGDTVTLTNQGKYVDMSGNVSSQRPEGSVFGELGTFSDNASNDFQLRDGFITSDMNWFLNEWRVQPSDPQLI